MKNRRASEQRSFNRYTSANHKACAHAGTTNNRKASASRKAAAHHTTSANRRKNRKSTSFGIVRNAIAAVLCLAILIGAYMAIESVCFSPEVNAEECLSELKYKVVEIQYGDTLWSIAKENMNPGFYDINDYINEIKECNQLQSDQINRGCSLLIPYYESTAVVQASVN